MKGGVSQNPDPAEGGEAVEDQRGDEPAVHGPVQQARFRGQCSSGFLEQQLAYGDAEHAGQGLEGEKEGHVGCDRQTEKYQEYTLIRC